MQEFPLKCGQHHMGLLFSFVIGATTGRVSGVVFPRPVLDDEVIGTKFFGPSCLTSVEFFSRHEELQIGMIRQDFDGVRTPLKIVTPFFECRNYGVVVCFRGV